MITVLLAEDNEGVAASIRRYLEHSDFEVLHAKNGESAVNIAIEQAPDVIVMDYQMPEVDGLEAIRRIRSAPKAANIPIIAATGLAVPNDATRFLNAGANRYICKPYRMRDLVNHILELSGEAAAAVESE